MGARSRSNKLILGGHMRSSEGLGVAVMAARSLRFNALQLMLCKRSHWAPYDISVGTVNQFRVRTVEIFVYVHLPFHINFCVNEEMKKRWTMSVMVNHMELARNLGAQAVVVHPGFKKLDSRGKAELNAQRFLGEVLGKDLGIKILLETDSGSKNGSAVGDADFIKGLLDGLGSDDLGMCVDTTHMYARGHNLWETQTREDFWKKHGQKIDLVHLNVPDANVELGSFRDRHNSTFNSFEERGDSASLIRFLAETEVPMILERSSFEVQRIDRDYIMCVLKEKEQKD